MNFLYLLEAIRSPVMNKMMLLVTRLGEETAFLVVALIVFWCVDKRKGYYILTAGFVGTIVNQFLKLVCAVPRPWVLDPNFTIVEAARDAATGYSFPSGHSQNAVATFGGVALTSHNRGIQIIAVVIAVLVPFSRMYLGVHTPADVLTGSLLSLGFLLVLKPMVSTSKTTAMRDIIGFLFALAACLLLYVELYPFPENFDAHNLTSGLKNAYTMLGCIIGLGIVYPVEKKYVRFETKATWWVQIIKVLFGLAAVLLVKEGLRVPLEMILPLYPARAVRYFLVVLTAGVLCLMTFRWFSKMGVKNELRND